MEIVLRPLLIGILVFVAPLISYAEGAFPLREHYPDIPIISQEELHSEFDTVIIVDVRSNLEYDVVHIKGAILNQIALVWFTSELEKLRPKNSGPKLVFYCNGHTCGKSYKATKKAIEAGFSNVYAYDAGVFDWIKAYPDKGVLMGESPVPTDKIISKEDFKKRVLPRDEFFKKAKLSKTKLIDIRDPIARTVKVPHLSAKIPLDKFKKNILANGVWSDKQLLIYDAVGRQVRWLHYFLREHGYEDYYFLDEGVNTYTQVQLQ